MAAVHFPQILWDVQCWKFVYLIHGWLDIYAIASKDKIIFILISHIYEPKMDYIFISFLISPGGNCGDQFFVGAGDNDLDMEWSRLAKREALPS